MLSSFGRYCLSVVTLGCCMVLCGCSSKSTPEDTPRSPAASSQEAVATPACVPVSLADLPGLGAVIENNDDGSCRVLNLTDLPAGTLAGGIDAADEQLKNIRVVRGKGTISKELAGTFTRMPRLTEFLWVDLGDSTEAVNSLAALPVKKLRLCGLDIAPAAYTFLARLTNVEDLDLSGSSITDDACPYLAELPKIKKLNLYQTAVGDRGLDSLAPLAGSVTWLNLDATAVSDTGVESLKTWTKLTFLHLGRTSIDDQAIGPLASLTGLEKLHVTRTQMSEEGMAALQEKLPSCQVVTRPE